MEHRCASDHDDTAEIEELLKQEQDPHRRVQLLLMHKLTNAISTMAADVGDLKADVNTLHGDVTKHTKDEAVMAGQIKFAVKVGGAILLIIQSVISYLYMDMNSRVGDLTQHYHADVVDHALMKGDMNVIKERIKQVQKVVK